MPVEGFGNTKLLNRVVTQMTPRQNFDAMAETDWTVFLLFSIGRNVKFDARVSKFLTPASKNLPV